MDNQFPDVIELNVGGDHCFTTLLSTLTKYEDSHLAYMFTGREPIYKDKNDKFYIDAEGPSFQVILTFLQNGELPYADTVTSAGLFGRPHFDSSGYERISKIHKLAVRLGIKPLVHHLERNKHIFVEQELQAYRKSKHGYDDCIARVYKTLTADIILDKHVTVLQLVQDFQSEDVAQCCKHECRSVAPNSFGGFGFGGGFGGNTALPEKLHQVKIPFTVDSTLLRCICIDLARQGFEINGIIGPCRVLCSQPNRQNFFSRSCCDKVLYMIMLTNIVPAQSFTEMPYGNQQYQTNAFGSAPKQGGLFGSNNTQQGFSFGSSASPQQQNSNLGGKQQGSLFGVNQQTTPLEGNQTGSAFGGNQQSTLFGGNQQGSSFGGNQQGSSFGGNQQGSSFGENQQQGLSFGTNQQGSSFGTKQQASSFGGNKPVSSFGGNQPVSSFGGNKQGSSFGGNQQFSSFASFGTNQQGSSFGGKQQGSTFGGAFKQGTVHQPGPLFGGTAFGVDQHKAAFGSSGFGQKAPTSEFGTSLQNNTTSELGNQTQPMFGKNQQNTFNFPINNNNTKPSFGGPGVFGKLGTSTQVFGNGEGTGMFGTYSGSQSIPSKVIDGFSFKYPNADSQGPATTSFSFKGVSPDDGSSSLPTNKENRAVSDNIPVSTESVPSPASQGETAGKQHKGDDEIQSVPDKDTDNVVSDSLHNLKLEPNNK